MRGKGLSGEVEEAGKTLVCGAVGGKPKMGAMGRWYEEKLERGRWVES